MPIYRVEKDKNYTVISNNTFIRDDKLSLGAIGLMCILLTCKDDTKFNINFISYISGKSNKVVSKYINELKKNNYLCIEKSNSKDGFIYKYHIYESKKLNEKYLENSPDTQNPTWESPTLDMGVYNKYYNNKINIDKLNLNFLTKILIKEKFISKTDTNILKYDKFLNEIIEDNDYRLVVEVILYTINKIKSNKYLDENKNPIINLFNYFKESVISNINLINKRNNEDILKDYR